MNPKVFYSLVKAQLPNFFTCWRTCVAFRSVLSSGPDNENWCCPRSTSSAKHTDTAQACLALRGLLPQTVHAGVRCGLPIVINLTSTVPQTQWHARANMEHIAENTSMCLKTLGALVAVIGTSCPLSLKTDSGSVIEVTLSRASFSWKFPSLRCKTARERRDANCCYHGNNIQV